MTEIFTNKFADNYKLGELPIFQLINFGPAFQFLIYWNNVNA